jgi:hypothetical protein
MPGGSSGHFEMNWLTHARSGTFGFDLGIFDQGVWLLSRFRDSFVTIRGLPLFGDHTSWECMPYLLVRLPGIDTTNYSARRSWAPLSL